MVASVPVSPNPGHWCAIVACAAIAVATPACLEPSDVEPAVEISAASLDSTHIVVGFPESLDPVAMADSKNYQISIAGGQDVAVSVLAAEVSDPVRGRSVRLETEPVGDGILVFIRVESVTLVTGTTLGNDPLVLDFVTGLSYQKDIAPLFSRRCNSCHAGGTPDASYLTDSYFALFGSGLAPPANLIPGDETSLLVKKCLPEGSMFWTGHLEYLDSEVIRNWVVVYMARQ